VLDLPGLRASGFRAKARMTGCADFVPVAFPKLAA